MVKFHAVDGYTFFGCKLSIIGEHYVNRRRATDEDSRLKIFCGVEEPVGDVIAATPQRMCGSALAPIAANQLGVG